jgi:hypothetical protein
VPRVLIRLVDWPIGVISHFVRILTERTPEISHHAIEVVDRLDTGNGGPTEQYRAAPEKWLAIIRDITEALPYQMSHTRLTSGPWEGRFE